MGGWIGLGFLLRVSLALLPTFFERNGRIGNWGVYGPMEKDEEWMGWFGENKEWIVDGLV